MSDRSKRERGSFNIATTDTAYKLSHRFACCDKCRVHFHEHMVCLNQYLRQTVEKFRSQIKITFFVVIKDIYMY